MPDLAHYRKNYMDADEFMDKYQIEDLYSLPDVSKYEVKVAKDAYEAGTLISIHDDEIVSIGWRSVNVLQRVVVSRRVHNGSKGWV